MRLLVDQNLSSNLVARLGDTLPGTQQVAGVGLDIATDSTDPVPAADEHGVIGKPVQLGDDTTVTITNPRIGGDEGPWIKVAVAFTNKSSTSAQPPMPDVVCAGATSGEGTQADSTFDLNADVKPGATSKGTLNLLPTGDKRIGPVVPECKGPAVIKVGDDGPTIPLPDEVLQAYNAAARATEAPS